MPGLFFDSGCLIDAARGFSPYSEVAVERIAKRRSVLLTSNYVWLETVPKAAYHQRQSELAFYEAFFSDSRLIWCRDFPRLHELAREQAVTCGLGAMDALHVAAAHLLGADELVTAERPAKALYRTPLVRVSDLYAGLR